MKKITIKLSDEDFETLHEMIQSLHCENKEGLHYWKTRGYHRLGDKYVQRLLVDVLKELFGDAKIHNGTVCCGRV